MDGFERIIMIKVTNEVPTLDDPAVPNVYVHSDWCGGSKVIIVIGEYKATVYAQDLKAAIDNAINRG